MKQITSLQKLSRIFKTFPVDYPEGVLTLRSETNVHEFYIKNLRFVEYHTPDLRIPGDLGRRFATHELISRQPPALESYEELWKWLDVPEIFHFHKERFRDLVYQAFLRSILHIDFEEGLPVKFKPMEIARETEFLPALQLHRFAADILKNSESHNDYEAFSADTIFMAGGELPPEVSFESLLLFQLLRDPKTYLELIEESFFPPNKTVTCIRELLRLESIVQMGGGVEFNFNALSESLGKANADEIDEDAGVSGDSTIPIDIGVGQSGSSRADDRKLSEVIEEKNSRRRKFVGLSLDRSSVTDEYLLSSLSYLILLFLFTLPWFFWRGLIMAFR
ncbi:MAG: hypothetical protein KDD70_12440 [Bdellovibrionales bacterium]|nr:hypothetical protein [Bdellovibrionales bacterium]